MFVPEIGQFAKSRHPRTLPIPRAGFSGAVQELFFKRLDEDLLQGNATGGGMGLGPPNHSIGEFDSRFHQMKLPRIQFFRKLPYEKGCILLTMSVGVLTELSS